MESWEDDLEAATLKGIMQTRSSERQDRSIFQTAERGRTLRCRPDTLLPTGKTKKRAFSFARCPNKDQKRWSHGSVEVCVMSMWRCCMQNGTIQTLPRSKGDVDFVTKGKGLGNQAESTRLTAMIVEAP